MKRLTVPCDFGGIKAPFHIYVRNPLPGHHPLRFQAAWLSEERAGAIPQEVMESFARLFDLARENHLSFEELCIYAFRSLEGRNNQYARRPI